MTRNLPSLFRLNTEYLPICFDVACNAKWAERYLRGVTFTLEAFNLKLSRSMLVNDNSGGSSDFNNYYSITTE